MLTQYTTHRGMPRALRHIVYPRAYMFLACSIFLFRNSWRLS